MLLVRFTVKEDVHTEMHRLKGLSDCAYSFSYLRNRIATIKTKLNQLGTTQLK